MMQFDNDICAEVVELQVGWSGSGMFRLEEAMLVVMMRKTKKR